MSDAKDSPAWWHSVPALVGAIAALITALTGAFLAWEKWNAGRVVADPCLAPEKLDRPVTCEDKK